MSRNIRHRLRLLRMRIHAIVPMSRANGPDSRFVIWVQGCSRKCTGCFNPETHDFKKGYELSIKDILNRIRKEGVAGITVSGGEPFEQPEELRLFLEQAGQKGLHRLVYTGFTYEELRAKNGLELELLSFVDMLIDGAYMQDISSVLPWTGSGNQRILQLKQGKIHKICEKNDFKAIETIDGEFIIGKNGTITATGTIKF